MKVDFYIDEKVTVWQRYHYTVEGKSLKEIKSIIKEEKENMMLDENEKVNFQTSEMLFETIENITQEENGGMPVKEAFLQKYNRKTKKVDTIDIK